METLIKLLYKFKIKFSEIKQIKKKKNWVSLTKKERKKIRKENYIVCKIMKNIFQDWDNCEFEYFVSDTVYQTEILPKTNCIDYGMYGVRHKLSYFSDKNYQHKFINNVKFPTVIGRCVNGDFYDEDFNLISHEELKKKLKKYDKLVFKKSIGIGHGKGVKLVVKKDFEKTILEFKDNFVIQDVIKQHKDLSYFNSSSVNVIRITSFYFEGEVYILGAILRVGAPGAFCDHLGNENINPRIIAIKEDGTLSNIAIDPDGKKVYNDIFGKEIIGKIPKYDEIKSIVFEQHKNYIHHKLIGWDFTIDSKNNVICIELNSTVPGIIQTQMACGPVFSKVTKKGKKFLDEIMNNK